MPYSDWYSDSSKWQRRRWGPGPGRERGREREREREPLSVLQMLMLIDPEWQEQQRVERERVERERVERERVEVELAQVLGMELGPGELVQEWWHRQKGPQHQAANWEWAVELQQEAERTEREAEQKREAEREAKREAKRFRRRLRKQLTLLKDVITGGILTKLNLHSLLLAMLLFALFLELLGWFILVGLFTTFLIYLLLIIYPSSLAFIALVKAVQCRAFSSLPSSANGAFTRPDTTPQTSNLPQDNIMFTNEHLSTIVQDSNNTLLLRRSRLSTY